MVLFVGAEAHVLFWTGRACQVGDGRAGNREENYFCVRL